jgi:aminoglycoside phosphotransferase family enzyme/predicted kinase
MVSGAKATEGAPGEEHLQSSLVEAMTQRGFYPKAPAEVLHYETHISHIFIAGDLAYKIKKAVRHPFVDYSTLAKRRHFLTEELQLNRRLAPSVYLAVVPICRGERGWQLSEQAHAAEYALIMRRLPEKRMLPFLLKTHQATPEMMRALADVVADFHRHAERPKALEPHRFLSLVQNQWDATLKEVRDFVGISIDGETYSTISQFGADFLKTNADLIIRRAEQGWVRDVHGDLHCGHVCFAPEGVQIFDCVEFSADFRCCDIASESAFLVMDLEAGGRADLAQAFLSRYMELQEDPELPGLLPFYRCYRALLRGKINALGWERTPDDAQRYFRYAGRVTWEPLRPFIVLLCGLTGSGKSTLARELGARLDMPVFSSDLIRNELAGKSGRQSVPLNTGLYAPALTEKTYGKIAREAERQIAAGRGAILDATFGRRAYREKMQRVAAKHGVPLFLIHCAVSEEAVKTRLVQRAGSENASDGRWDIYLEQRAACQPIREIPPADCLDLNTEAPLDEIAAVCERFLRARFAQRMDRR